MNQRRLNGAILNKLATDSTLTTLLGHASNTPRILVADPKINEAVYPCLVFTSVNIKSAVEDGPTGLNEGIFNFTAFSKEQGTVYDIISRLKTLFDSDNVTQTNNFLDFTNSYICNRFTIFRSIGECDFSNEYDCYSQNLIIKVFWTDK